VTAVAAAEGALGGGDQHGIGVAAIDRDRMDLEILRQAVIESVPAPAADRLAKDAAAPALRRFHCTDVDMVDRRHTRLPASASTACGIIRLSSPLSQNFAGP